MAAERCTPEAVNFMVTHGRGIVCLPVAAWRLDELQIPQMVPTRRWSTTRRSPCRSTTGPPSPPARARTTVPPRPAAIADPAVGPQDFHQPGHVFPLRAKEGGVLRRAGHTEAAVDLARLAGLFPAGVICEVMNEDGTMARLPELAPGRRRARPQADLDRRPDRVPPPARGARAPRRRGDDPDRVRRLPGATPTRALVDGRTHVALVCGDIGDGEKVLTRVHSECLTGDVFGSLRCDCGTQLDTALQRVGEEGRGVVLYMRGHEGRAIGLTHKLRAYRAAGAGPRHGRGEPGAGVRRRPARLRDRGADPRRPRRADDAPADEQPRQASRARGLRPIDRGAPAAPDGADAGELALPAHQAGEARAPARRRGPRRNGVENGARRGRRRAGCASRSWPRGSTRSSPSRSSRARSAASPTPASATRTSTVAWVPGAFEIPLIAERLAASGTVDAVIVPGGGDPRRDGAFRAGGGGGGPRHRRGRTLRPASPCLRGARDRRSGAGARPAPGARTATRAGRPPVWRSRWHSSCGSCREAAHDRRQARGANADVRAQPTGDRSG